MPILPNLTEPIYLVETRLLVGAMLFFRMADRIPVHLIGKYGTHGINTSKFSVSEQRVANPGLISQEMFLPFTFHELVKEAQLAAASADVHLVVILKHDQFAFGVNLGARCDRTTCSGLSFGDMELDGEGVKLANWVIHQGEVEFEDVSKRSPEGLSAVSLSGRMATLVQLGQLKMLTMSLRKT
jgi:hypothetical protein